MTTEKKVGMGIAGQPTGGAVNVADVFSTYLYTGTGGNQTLINGIDLAGEGGMVWLKGRNGASNIAHQLFDTDRGTNNALDSGSTAAQVVNGNSLKNFNNNGFNLGVDSTTNFLNDNFASWTFRKAPKFFDVVTYTGHGVAGREIAHSLGGAVGFMAIKKTNSTGYWWTYNIGLGNKHGRLDDSNLFWADNGNFFGNGSTHIPPTSSAFTVSANTNVNATGDTYVAYLWADNSTEDADEQMIKCGSYTGNGSTTGPEINLGWEPQYVMIKCTTITPTDWVMFDTMRGIPTGGNDTLLKANNDGGENSGGDHLALTPTGFNLKQGYSTINSNGATYIYMAIRAPMMVEPESGTEVFAIDTQGSTGDGLAPAHRSSFPVDMAIRTNASNSAGYTSARLIHGTYLITNTTAAGAANTAFEFDYQSGWADYLTTVTSLYSYMFKRAKGFFDVVAYTGTGVAGRTVAHSLGVAPEMIWVKSRNANINWEVYHYGTGNTHEMRVNQDNLSQANSTYWNNTDPTSAVFTLGSGQNVNRSAWTYIAYLFASLDGVSKVGSYTGNGTSQTLNCGFAAGARFILIKRTDATGDWYIWDTTRGIVAGTESHLSLNTTTAEVTTDDSVDPDNSGFIVNQVAATNINVSSGTYIFYAIA